ncbi:MAG: hypothetical protein AAF467_15730 [Actinomycetota bacterium]
MVLHAFDDFAIHQTPEPLTHVGTSSPNAYDRYFFNGFDPTGELFFAAAFGLYPNREVIDGAFSVIRHGVQHNVRASGRMPGDRSTIVGPIRVEVIEPMRRHRVIVVDGHGMEADLEWSMISPAIEEPRFTWAIDGRVILDYTRLTQFGRWSGTISIDGDEIEVGATTVNGVRDRSWGVRPVGARQAGPARVPQFYWIWTPTVFDDVCTHLALNQHADGRPWHQSGAVVPRIGPDADPLDPAGIQRSLAAKAWPRWAPGTRWIEAASVGLERWEAEPIVVDYEPLVRFQMSGIGYTHPEWGHGHWRGEADSTRDEIVLAEANPGDPTMVHVQTLCRATWGDRVGTGVVEQLVIGPHEPTGLTGIVDGA